MTKPEEATVPTAVGTPLEPSVWRLPDEATNACGPRGTYGCACVSRDMRECIRVRYRGLFDNLHDHCECLCHHWRDDDDDSDV